MYTIEMYAVFNTYKITFYYKDIIVRILIIYKYRYSNYNSYNIFPILKYAVFYILLYSSALCSS